MTLVLDASVIIKWLLNDPKREAGTEKATEIMGLVTRGDLTTAQPIHWLAEVGAVLARETPATAPSLVALLYALDLPTISDPLILKRSVELAIELRQHVFDTLYHAVALDIPDGILITADSRYLRAARSKGRILDLLDWA